MELEEIGCSWMGAGTWATTRTSPPGRRRVPRHRRSRGWLPRLCPREGEPGLTREPADERAWATRRRGVASLNSELRLAASRVELRHPLARNERRPVALAPDVIGQPEEADHDHEHGARRGGRSRNHVRSVRKDDCYWLPLGKRRRAPALPKRPCRAFSGGAALPEDHRRRAGRDAGPDPGPRARAGADC